MHQQDRGIIFCASSSGGVVKIICVLPNSLLHSVIHHKTRSLCFKVCVSKIVCSVQRTTSKNAVNSLTVCIDMEIYNFQIKWAHDYGGMLWDKKPSYWISYKHKAIQTVTEQCISESGFFQFFTRIKTRVRFNVKVLANSAFSTASCEEIKIQTHW